VGVEVSSFGVAEGVVCGFVWVWVFWCLGLIIGGVECTVTVPPIASVVLNESHAHDKG